MMMVCGGSSDQAAFGNNSSERAGGCEGCDGNGIRCPAEPSCVLPDLPVGCVVVERCDYCERYPNDLAAAQAVCEDAKWIRCESGGLHTVGRLVKVREGE